VKLHQLADFYLIDSSVFERGHYRHH